MFGQSEFTKPKLYNPTYNQRDSKKQSTGYACLHILYVGTEEGGHKFEDSLGYLRRPCLKTTNQPTNQPNK